jgi:hypothetical protein
VTDQTGDGVRVVEWDPPIPIPGLSRAAQAWLRFAATRPLPPGVARRVYRERAARVQAFVSSADFSALVGAEPARDRLAALPGDERRAVLAFGQRYLPVPTDAAVVRGARVSVSFGTDAGTIRSVVSTFQPDLSPPEVEVAAAEAVDTALAAAAELGTVPAVPADDPVPLVVLRKPAFFGGARRATEVRRANDRLAYAVRLVTDDAVHRELVEVLIDAATGQPRELIPLSSSGGFSVSLSPVPFISPVPTDSLLEAVICGAWEGQGLDTDLVLRRFSTTFFPSEPAPFAMVSCNEPAYDRMVKARDIVTFNGTKPFVDDDDVWIGPDPLLRHAVNTQYWGERALRFFKKNGYQSREGSGQPVRFVAWQRAGAEKAEFTKISTSFGLENGVIEVGVGGPHFETSADPMVLAHELAHSVWTDVLPFPAAKTEENAIFEGLADCFAMAAMGDLTEEWEQSPLENPPHVGYTDAALADRAPFSFWAGSYVDDAHLATPGYPNLWDPKLSWPLGWPSPSFRFTRWSGLRSTFHDHEEDSTLVGAVCRMFVTGGHSPVGGSARAVTAGAHFSDALAYSGSGVDRRAGFARVTRLLLYTLLEAKHHPTSFHDLIDILAANAQTLAASEWGVGYLDYQERVKRAAGQYGFGRGLENESLGNTATKVNPLGDAAAANLIAAGSNFSRPIAGTLCSGDEDFFVVNEEAGVGDLIDFAASSNTASVTLDVRLFRHKACAFDDKDCAKSYQLYPPVDSAGNSPENAPPSDVFAFAGPSGGSCPPGVPCSGNYWKLFAGVRMKPGGPCNSGYKLRVEFKPRAAGNKGVE